jgi:hypothetical protein
MQIPEAKYITLSIVVEVPKGMNGDDLGLAMAEAAVVVAGCECLDGIPSECKAGEWSSVSKPVWDDDQMEALYQEMAVPEGELVKYISTHAGYTPGYDLTRFHTLLDFMGDLDASEIADLAQVFYQLPEQIREYVSDRIDADAEEYFQHMTDKPRRKKEKQ